MYCGCKPGGDHPLDFGRKAAGGIDLADEREGEGAVGKYEDVALKALVAPDEDLELIAGIDPVRRGRARSPMAARTAALAPLQPERNS